jgi:hypothetical protein
VVWAGIQRSFQLLVAFSLLLMASRSFAQSKWRGFSYQSSDAVAGDYGSATGTDLRMTTRTVVRPYLYVSGVLQASWVVEGWGEGTHQRSESLRFFHNQAISLTIRQFDDLKKVSGTTLGSQALLMEGEFLFVNGLTGAMLFDTGVLDQRSLSNLSDYVPHAFGIDDTGGILLVQIQRTVTLSQSAGPGIYENTGTITVVRN